MPNFKSEMALERADEEIDTDPSVSAAVLERANVLVVIDQFEELFREENRGQAQAADLVGLVVDCWQRRGENPGSTSR